jgi:transposase
MAKKYSIEIKLAAVNTYLDGVESIRDTAKKIRISKTMLHRWVARFERHGSEPFMNLYKLFF